MRDRDATVDAVAPERTAEDWFVRLAQSDCTPAERAAFAHWRAADPAHDAAFDAVERLWGEGLQVVRDPTLLDPEILRVAERAWQDTQPAPRLRRWWPLTAAAAAAVALAVLLPRVWILPPAGTSYATAQGEQRTVQLADGSRVVLDTATEIVERYHRRERRVDLLRGRASFQVSHLRDADRQPFVVRAGNGTVTALGTEFQVRRAGAGTVVTLLEGSVVVARAADTEAAARTLLRPGEQISLDREGHPGARAPADLKAARGWTEGKLFVNDWRLADLLMEMNAYSTTRIRLGDPALSDLRVSGVFRAGDQRSLLAVLQGAWALRADPAGPDEIVLTRQ